MCDGHDDHLNSEQTEPMGRTHLFVHRVFVMEVNVTAMRHANI